MVTTIMMMAEARAIATLINVTMTMVATPMMVVTKMIARIAHCNKIVSYLV